MTRLEKTSGTLASVLIDLTKRGQMKASEDAAAHVLDGLSRIGRNHKPHIERANFAVLRTSDMPAMLVETAFISNPEEERRLADPAYQRWRDMRNVLTHRAAPGRRVYVGLGADDAPPVEWKLNGLPLDSGLVPNHQRELSQLIGDVLSAAVTFLATRA